MKKMLVLLLFIGINWIVPAMALEIQPEDIYKYNNKELEVLIYDTCIKDRETLVVNGLEYEADVGPIYNAEGLRGGTTKIEENKDYINKKYTLYMRDTRTYGDISETDIKMAEDTAKEIADKAKEMYTTNQVNQLKYVNNWLCDNCIYTTHKLGSTGNDAYGALIDGKPVCEGYALATALICDELGIPNILIYTDTIESGERHCYNQVYVEGKWSILDVTWNDTDGYRWRYFLCKEPCAKYAKYDEAEADRIKEVKYNNIVETQANYIESLSKRLDIDIQDIINGDRSRVANKNDLIEILDVLEKALGKQLKPEINKVNNSDKLSKNDMCKIMVQFAQLETDVYTSSNIVDLAVREGIISGYRTDRCRGTDVKISDLIDTAYRVYRLMEGQV